MVSINSTTAFVGRTRPAAGFHSTTPCFFQNRRVRLVDLSIHRFIAGCGLAVRPGAVLLGGESVGQLVTVNLVGLVFV
nr:hypothetical protein [Natronosalvus caseinilyticus]